MAEPWLAALEQRLSADESGEALAIGIVVLASVAGAEVRADPAEVRGAARRALLLLATGGDPERGLDLHGRAVGAMADDLRTVDRQLALEAGIRELMIRAKGLAHVSEAVHALADAPDVAWRAYAAGLLAEELSADD
jgi:hypothetical protein